MVCLLLSFWNIQCSVQNGNDCNAQVHNLHTELLLPSPQEEQSLTTCSLYTGHGRSPCTGFIQNAQHCPIATLLRCHSLTFTNTALTQQHAALYSYPWR